jgi:hypothetical protein
MNLGAILAGDSTTIGSVTVSASTAANIVGSLGLSFGQLGAAIKAKNWSEAAEVTIDDILVFAADLGFGQPFTGIVAKLLPALFAQGEKHLGLSPEQAELFPSTHSLDDKTNNGWPTANQP